MRALNTAEIDSTHLIFGDLGPSPLDHVSTKERSRTAHRAPSMLVQRSAELGIIQIKESWTDHPRTCVMDYYVG